MPKTKKPTPAQQAARKEYQRIRKNIRNKQSYYRRKYGKEPEEALPKVLGKGYTAREYKKASKELKQYEKEMYRRKTGPNKIDILVEMIRAKIRRIPLPARKLYPGERSGRDMISEWFETAISVYGKEKAVYAVQKMEEAGYTLDGNVRYENQADEWINQAMEYLTRDISRNEFMNNIQFESGDWSDVL